MMLFLLQNHAFLGASLNNRNHAEIYAVLAMRNMQEKKFRHKIQAPIFINITVLKKGCLIYRFKRDE